MGSTESYMYVYLGLVNGNTWSAYLLIIKFRSANNVQRYLSILLWGLCIYYRNSIAPEPQRECSRKNERLSIQILQTKVIYVNIKMSSSLSKILETGINVFKSNYQIIKNILKYQLYMNASKNNRWLFVVISEWFVWN